MRTPEQLAVIATIADGLAAGIWVATVPDGTLVYANRAFDEIVGAPPKDDVPAGVYSTSYGIYDREGALYPEERLPFARAYSERCTVVVDDLVIHRHDGRRVFVRASGTPLYDSAGEMRNIAVAFFDITREAEAERARAIAERASAELLARAIAERRHAEAAEERLRRVVADAPIVLYSMDADGIVTLAEGRGLARLGAMASALVGRSVFDLFPESPRAAENCRRVLAGESVSHVVDLGEVVFDTRLAPVRSPDSGAVIGAIGVATDVTERHRIEARLAQAERLASVGMLAAGVAHEINNPLSYVLGNLELLEREIPKPLASASHAAPSTLAALIGDAREGAERVRAIVRDLKVFSRVSAPNATAIDVRVPLEAALSMARNEIRHRARLAVRLDAVPTVWGDEGRLAQLFLNLLVNAAQAMPEGHADEHEIRLTLDSATRGYVRIAVHDDGAGMEPEELPKIFDPFYSTKPLGVGTGLGLSICQSIATELGGRIEVSSDVGRGSTFSVFLPIAPTPSRESKPPRSEPAAAGRRGAVLVIDDEPQILNVIEALLGVEHAVTCVERPDAAVARIRAGERFDAIVCDVTMPIMNGLEVYEELARLAPSQAKAMIFLTGGVFNARVREGLAALENSVIEKPFDPSALAASVRMRVG